MVEDRFGLFALNTRKPTQEVSNRSVIPQVLEQSADRHPRASEYPGSSDFAWYLFNSTTGAPMAHIARHGAIQLFVLLLHLHTFPSGSERRSAPNAPIMLDSVPSRTGTRGQGQLRWASKVCAVLDER